MQWLSHRLIYDNYNKSFDLIKDFFKNKLIYFYISYYFKKYDTRAGAKEIQ
jgi:hypothetical protein